MTVSWTVLTSEHGSVSAGWQAGDADADDWGLVGIELGEPPGEAGPVVAHPGVRAWLERLIAGDPAAVHEGLQRCTWVGLTTFARSVLSTLASQVGPGQVVSYGELAALAGRPKAARAVGGVMGRNPYPLLIPCHRVVAGGGRIGGFMRGRPGGIERKRAMLQAEGIRVTGDRVAR